ncbi:MAG TPA: phosphoglucomutase/phosphomannomutase family protein [Verrucomicrobiota bacterium]|nr:phosphoglucomutase/phosphomannomutase family protein [Verrucomicrobiota bacterium]HNU49682.1 phosphoglucomutase/phosphomannomutase family protein [Verrucomicrobiota bacterium]
MRATLSPAVLRFGTDGWRGVIADTFTFANVERVAQAAADQWNLAPPPGPACKSIVVGYDRRFLSDQFALRTAEVLAGNGFDVILTPVPTPTPAVCWAVRARKATGGVLITASHNPAVFNGFKLKAWHGGAADPALCAAVESRLDRGPVRRCPAAEGVGSGRIRIVDVRPGHYRAVRGLVDFRRVARMPLRLAHDALFGVGAGCFEVLLAGTRCRVTTLNGRHDALFGGIHPEPIAANYGPTQAWLRRHPQDVCLVTDGDADRIGGMDGRGRPLTTHQILSLLLEHRLVRRGGRGRVVKALTTTSMVDRICAEHNLPLTVTGVGFKHLCAEMVKGDVLLGVEESGGVGFPEHLPDRDGIAAGLVFLEMLAIEGLSVGRLLRRLERRYGPHHYGRRDLAFPRERLEDLMALCRAHPPDRLLRSPVARVDTFDGVKYTADDGTWLMLRGSGTEPVVRVYAEARSVGNADRLLDCGERMMKRVLTSGR